MVTSPPFAPSPNRPSPKPRDWAISAKPSLRTPYDANRNQEICEISQRTRRTFRTIYFGRVENGTDLFTSRGSCARGLVLQHRPGCVLHSGPVITLLAESVHGSPSLHPGARPIRSDSPPQARSPEPRSAMPYSEGKARGREKLGDIVQYFNNDPLSRFKIPGLSASISSYLKTQGGFSCSRPTG